MDRMFFALCGVFGFLAVSCGAFGAHGLRAHFAALEDGAKRAEWWQTAAQYHLAHALALAVAAYLVTRTRGTAATIAGVAFVGGTVLFSGSLYTMALTGARWLGAVTPIGGALFLVGWGAVVVAALALR